MKINLEDINQYRRFLYTHDKLHIPICDGCTEQSGTIFNVLFPLFIVTGISFFLWILIRYLSIKEQVEEKIGNKEEIQI